MIASQYAPLARRTLKELPREQHFIHMAMGLCGELGEFLDALKKSVIYGKELDLVNLTEETGDVLWYAANLLPELGVDSMILQRSLDAGHAQGTSSRSQLGDNAGMTLAQHLLAINFAVAAVSNAIANDPAKYVTGSSAAVQVIETLGRLVGSLCGLFKLNPHEAMELNIKKLAKRYGDKYSDVAALNRDTAAERAVLEGDGYAVGGVIEGVPHVVGESADDFELPAKACDLGKPEGCESCQ